MEQKPADLRKKIARYQRPRVVMNDADTIRMIDRMIKELQEQIETAETRWAAVDDLSSHARQHDGARLSRPRSRLTARLPRLKAESAAQ